MFHHCILLLSLLLSCADESVDVEGGSPSAPCAPSETVVFVESHTISDQTLRDAFSEEGDAFILTPHRGPDDTLDGVRISGLSPDGAAVRMGLQDEDMILTVDDVSITSGEGLRSALTSTPAGARLVISVMRHGQAHRLQYTVEPAVASAKPAEATPVSYSIVQVQEHQYRVSREGLHSLSLLSERLYAQIRLVPEHDERGNVSGYRLTGIRRTGLPWMFGLRNGDVLHRINDQPVTMQMLEGWLAEQVRTQGHITLHLTRSEQPLSLVYQLSDPDPHYALTPLPDAP